MPQKKLTYCILLVVKREREVTFIVAILSPRDCLPIASCSAAIDLRGCINMKLIDRKSVLV